MSTNFNEVANVKFSIAPLSSEYASKVAIEGMFKNKLLIIFADFLKLMKKIYTFKYLT